MYYRSYGALLYEEDILSQYKCCWTLLCTLLLTKPNVSSVDLPSLKVPRQNIISHSLWKVTSILVGFYPIVVGVVPLDMLRQCSSDYIRVLKQQHLPTMVSPFRALDSISADAVAGKKKDKCSYFGLWKLKKKSQSRPEDLTSQSTCVVSRTDKVVTTGHSPVSAPNSASLAGIV